MMKKILMSLMVAFSISGMAAVQYGMNIETANDYVQAGAVSGISGWSVVAKQNVTMTLNSNLDLLSSVNNHMKNTIIPNLTSGAFTPTHTALGYFIYDAAAKAASQTYTLDFSSGLASISLKEGETLGFWITMDDVTYSSINNVAGFTNKSSVMGGGDTGNGMKVYNYGNSWYLNGSAYGYEQSFLISVEATPAGQPLPGVLAAILLGGGVIGAVNKKRKKLVK